MTFRTEAILQEAEKLPQDESSITCVERNFSDTVSAGQFFAELKQNILDVSHWNHKSGLTSYQLFGGTGKPMNDQRIKLDAFIQITLTGSGKSDWVRVEEIYDVENELVITVRPSYDPTGDPQQTGKISHFFWNQATNNFCVFQKGDHVSLCVIGLNERLNSDHTSNLLETVRNTAVADLGYYLGIQKAEWKKFCKSFLFDDQEQAAR
jgi:hypothetical protein